MCVWLCECMNANSVGSRMSNAHMILTAQCGAPHANARRVYKLDSIAAVQQQAPSHVSIVEFGIQKQHNCKLGTWVVSRWAGQCCVTISSITAETRQCALRRVAWYGRDAQHCHRVTSVVRITAAHGNAKCVLVIRVHKLGCVHNPARLGGEFTYGSNERQGGGYGGS